MVVAVAVVADVAFALSVELKLLATPDPLGVNVPSGERAMISMFIDC